MIANLRDATVSDEIKEIKKGEIPRMEDVPGDDGN